MISHLLSSALPPTPHTWQEGLRGLKPAGLCPGWFSTGDERGSPFSEHIKMQIFGEALTYSSIWVIFIKMSPHARVATQETFASCPKGLRFLLLRELVVKLILTQIKQCIFPIFCSQTLPIGFTEMLIKKTVSHQDRHHHEKFQPNWLIFNNVHMAC